jgi:hypothetical protein
MTFSSEVWSSVVTKGWDGEGAGEAAVGSFTDIVAMDQQSRIVARV